MSDSILKFYKEKFSDYSEQFKKTKRRQKIIVLLRLSFFILMVFLPLAFFSYSILIAVIAFIVPFAIFLFLVRRFIALEKKVSYTSCMIGINAHEIEAQRGDFGSFDDGSGFIDADHQFATDLDLFGPDSLFQYINRCCTLQGKEKLAGMLLEPAEKPEVIHRHQKAYRELTGKIDLCQHFLAMGRMYSNDQSDRLQMLKYLKSPSWFTRNQLLVLYSRILPVLTLATLVLAIAGVLPFVIAAALILVQLGITWRLLARINEVHEQVSRSLKTLKKNGKLLHIIQSASFEAPLLKSVQRHLKSMGLPPSGHIENLSRIVEAFDNRLNIIVSIFLNGLLLWDVNCVLLLERWKRRNRKNLPVWLDSIARMDAYISFSVFAFNNPGYVFPTILKEGPVIRAKALGHPLIPERERVCNDFSIGETGKFIIITGANMAGKSTFLRTAGVAMMLAMAGAPVCAGGFGFRIMELYTSMRTSDSLSRNESYFYAELKRLKNLIERLAEGKQVFIILDEILKGTNTTDKQKGSVALLGQMISLGSTGIVATHDLSLASLEKAYPGRIENKCFEVEIEGDRIFFDYRLRDGVTRKMNALVLMKQMGLLTEPPDAVKVRQTGET